MSHPGSQYPVTIHASDRNHLDAELECVVDGAIRTALANPGRGVVVTRLNYKTFTVELSTEVPHGITVERDLFHS